MSFTSQTPQPILAWNFDGSTTSYIGGVAPTTTNGTVSYQTGIYGQAFYINGTTSNVIYSVTDIPSNPGMTMCFWWNPTSTLAGNLLDMSSVTSGAVTNDRINVTLDGTGRLVVNFSPITSWTSPVLGNGGWYHVAIVATNTSYSTYFNGIFQTTVTASFPTITTYGRNLSIGCLAGGTGTAGNGLIDDLCIYNKVLTATQIGLVYNTKGMPRLGAGNWSVPGPYGTGGTVTTFGGNRIHSFTASSTFVCMVPGVVNLLVVAGGGAGGQSRAHGSGKGAPPDVCGGGGGGGEVFYSTSYYVSKGSYNILIGGGGGLPGTGGVSSFGLLKANGGGCGGYYTIGANGVAGGSGGGGAYFGSGVTGVGGASILTAGGYGNVGGGTDGGLGGGGGGAGSAGAITTYGAGGNSGTGVVAGGLGLGNGASSGAYGSGLSYGFGGTGIVIISYQDVTSPISEATMNNSIV